MKVLLQLFSRRAWRAVSVVLCGLVIVGCGGTSTRNTATAVPHKPTPHVPSASETGFAYSVLGELFPTNGQDQADGYQTADFAEAAIDKAEAGCMSADGLPGPLTVPQIPTEEYGSTELPNMPLIERNESLGLTVHVSFPASPTEAMSSAERVAYTARLKRCSAAPRNVFAFLQDGAAGALTNEWANVMAQTTASATVQRLNRAAAACSRKTPFAASSVETEVMTIDSKVTPYNLRGDDVGAHTTEVAGVKVLVRCFGPEVSLIDQLLAQRRQQFFASNAQSITAIERAANDAVATMMRRYGVRVPSASRRAAH